MKKESNPHPPEGATKPPAPPGPPEQQVCADDLISAAVDRICGPAFDLIQKDPHQWSDRGCVTCETITSLIQRPFGCVLYSKRKRGR